MSASNLRRLAALIGILLTLIGLAVFTDRVYIALSPSSLTASPRQIDFGSVPQGSVNRATLTLRNTGSQPITIEEISASCGCTVATTSKRVIPVRSTIPMEVVLDTTGKSGPTVSLVRLFIQNHPADPFVIPLHANIREIVRFTPFKVDIGHVSRNHPSSAEVEIHRLDDQRLIISHMQSPPGVATRVTHSSKNSARILISVSNKALPGQYNSEILIHVAGLPAFRVGLSYEMEGIFRVQPSLCNFGVMKPGETKTIHVRIDGPGAGLMSVPVVPAYYTVKAKRITDDRNELVMTFVGKGSGGTLNQSVVELRTGNPSQPIIYIPAYAAVGS